MSLADFGWTDDWRAKFSAYAERGLQPARILEEGTHIYRIAVDGGERLAEVSGRFRYEASGRYDYPAVGDWVAVSGENEDDRARIHALLPRRSCFRRKLAGTEVDVQVVAANVDTVWVVLAANDANLRRLERYLTVAWESDAQPVVVLSKADLIPDSDALLSTVQQVAPGVPVHAVSVTTDFGMQALDAYLLRGQTVALLGSSGAGKSTLVNHIWGRPIAQVQEVRAEDLRGRHTTTQRSLYALPTGACLMDTPGMRELQMWDGDTGVDDAFQEIVSLTERCAFRDCQHKTEPGCAIQAALSDGRLSEPRYRSYVKLQRELERAAHKQDKRMHSSMKETHKKVSFQARQRKHH